MYLPDPLPNSIMYVFTLLLPPLSSQMTGPEATRILRNTYGSKLIVIGVTGNILSEDVTHFIDHGANAVLSKPFDFNKFLSLLEQFSD